MNTLEKLQRWYLSQCDGDWEHGYGIKIDTLDNPGWHVSISVAETPWKLKPFRDVQTAISASDWITCRVEGQKFEGFCGPTNLNQVLEIFLQWVEAGTPPKGHDADKPID